MSRSQPFLGVIADDITGATDLGNALVREGMQVVLVLGVPASKASTLGACDALIVALKSRSIEPDAAVSQSLSALAWLRDAGVQRFYFKYCSTFDSTPRGNIGPVAKALAEDLNTELWVACPAFPDTGRTVYQGHLFVDDRLLSESGMRHHPLNPMTDPDLVRFLSLQVRGQAGLVPLGVVRQGARAVGLRLDQLRASGVQAVLLDATSNDELRILSDACADLPLVTGASGLAMGLPGAYRQRGWIREAAVSPRLPAVKGPGAVLAGSCSGATLRQVLHMVSRCPVLRLSVDAVLDPDRTVQQSLDWCRANLGPAPILVFTSAEPGYVAAAQKRHGTEALGRAFEQVLAQVAAGLVEAGVRKLVVAGGETSGAIVQALDIQALRIGPEIDPGVPWTETTGEPKLALALKSGNFGRDDFFLRALEMF